MTPKLELEVVGARQAVELTEANSEDPRWQQKNTSTLTSIADRNREAGWLDALFAGYRKASKIQEEVMRKPDPNGIRPV